MNKDFPTPPPGFEFTTEDWDAISPFPNDRIIARLEAEIDFLQGKIKWLQKQVRWLRNVGKR